MDCERIGDKGTMYRRLARGSFGNTIPQFFSVEEWRASGEADKFPAWGVRTLRPGGPCRLYCPTAEVEATCRSPEFAAAGVNISIMGDAVCPVLLWADVWESPAGLVVYGIEYPPRGSSWRALMPTKGRHWERTAARMILARHLNPNSLADLYATLELWPGHVVELSAYERCLGVIPGRNGVLWEVRDY
jgi:hypothetical protein